MIIVHPSGPTRRGVFLIKNAQVLSSARHTHRNGPVRTGPYRFMARTTLGLHWSWDKRGLKDLSGANLHFKFEINLIPLKKSEMPVGLELKDETIKERIDFKCYKGNTSSMACFKVKCQ